MYVAALVPDAAAAACWQMPVQMPPYVAEPPEPTTQTSFDLRPTAHLTTHPRR